MKKKLLALFLVVAMCFAFIACSSSKEFVTLEQYKAWQQEEDRWNMSVEDLEEYFGVKAIIDEEGTASWGEGYQVVDFPGPDEDSYLHILLQQSDDGNWSICSVNASGALISD